MEKKKKNACRTLVEKPEGKIWLGKPRRRSVVNIKMDFIERICDDVD
jgi:hypothetical protein